MRHIQTTGDMELQNIHKMVYNHQAQRVLRESGWLLFSQHIQTIRDIL